MKLEDVSFFCSLEFFCLLSPLLAHCVDAMQTRNSDLINRYVVLLCIIKHLSQRIFGRIWCKGNQIQRRIGNERRISLGFWPDSQECLHRTLLIVPSHSFVHSNAKFDEYNLTIKISFNITQRLDN